MKIVIEKNILFKKIDLASRFTANQITSAQVLQGILLKTKNKKINLYSSNLNSFFNTIISSETDKEINIVFEPRKILEFLNLLPNGQVEVEIGDKKINIIQKKTKGVFPLLVASDFPLPPEVTEKGQKIKTSTLKKSLDKILFSAASDETRPALTGVNMIANEELTMVTTDGFRLSIVKTPKIIDHPSLIVPAAFLETMLRAIDQEEDVVFNYLKDEKMIVFKSGINVFYSRLIEGEFPPYEKVIPEKYVTKSTVDKEELTRAVKLIAVFARELSNVVIIKFGKNEILVRPKTEQGENSSLIEAESEGEEQTVAFNYKFILDFLSHSEGKNILIEVLRPDAPVVFRSEKEAGFFHIIMPVRIQEE